MIFSFKIFCDDSRQTANGLIQMTPTPKQPQRIRQLLNAISPMKQMIDALAEACFHRRVVSHTRLMQTVDRYILLLILPGV